MLEEDLDDTHLCIKCSATIVGLENYVQHRKSNCSTHKSSTPISRDVVHIDHPYGTYDFAESKEVEKTTKSLADNCYDLPYDLGADVFFSSLELQSSSKRNIPTPGGKVSLNRVLTRRTVATIMSNSLNVDDWIGAPNNSDNLMKAVHDISGTKKCDSVFKLISFQHDSQSPSEEEDNQDDDDDEDYCLPLSTHTGGKWKPPDNSPNPRTVNLENSPAWGDERRQWEMLDTIIVQENEDFDHDLNPPPGHTKGKWVPGSKVIKLDYKPDEEPEKVFSRHYWCNTCNRKLSSKQLYDKHIKSNLHLKRLQPELELEQAARPGTPIKFSERIKKPPEHLDSDAIVSPPPKKKLRLRKKRKNSKSKPLLESDKKKKTFGGRHKLYTRCDICKIRMNKFLLGKHLISHYHYRRMILNPSISFQMILDNIHRIVYQSPFQCKPCRYYTNTEHDFMIHWNSSEHCDMTEGPGNFWCTFCKFECEDNNQMRRHLLGSEHKDVIQAINRSMPIVIFKRVTIECPKCKQTFRYNIELRKHSTYCSVEPIGTASDKYQSKYYCSSCGEVCKSRLALQKHKRIKHDERKNLFFCSICEINFETTDEAKRHRNTTEHKITTASFKKNKFLTKICKCCGEVCVNLLKLKEHLWSNHPEERYSCPYCGKTFVLPQEVGRHMRDKRCQASTSQQIQSTEVSKSLIECDAMLTLEPTVTATAAVIKPFCGNSSSSLSSLAPTGLDSSTIKVIKIESLDTPLILNRVLHKPSEPPTEDGPVMAANLFGCKQCHFRTDIKAELIYHEILHNVKDEHAQMKISCTFCEKKFVRHSLRCHLRKHTNERLFPCNLCSMSFTRKHNLKTHISNIHKAEEDRIVEMGSELPTYQCDTCGKIFNKLNSLKQHTTIHSERDKKFSCPYESCIFVGRTAADVRSHLSVHSSDKNFACDFDGCDYKGKSMTLLKRHSKQHNPCSKEYPCPNCNFKTKIIGHLRRHMRIHTGEKPYKCPHCDYTCNNSENLRKHVLTTSKHPGMFLYECKFCIAEDTIFKTNFQKEFRAHLIVVHRKDGDFNKMKMLMNNEINVNDNEINVIVNDYENITNKEELIIIDDENLTSAKIVNC